MEWPIPFRGPIDPATIAPPYFLLVQDMCVGISALFWSIAYILYIKQSFRDLSYGMPLLSL
jgi:paspaline synthase